MMETRGAEIDIEELKDRIRLAVERREAEGRTSFAKATADLFELLAQEDFSVDRWLSEPLPGSDVNQPPGELQLQPEFVPQPDGYHVNDLLKYHDHQFIWNAYRALLRREPDEVGFRQHLEHLRSGRINKVDLLARLRYSPEGQRENVSIEGLRAVGVIRRAYRVPVIGYVLELMATVARLPSLVHGQRQSETYLIGQQERIADQLNQSQRAWSAQFRNQQELLDSLKHAISEVARQQKHYARLQHQQLAAVLRKQPVNGQPAEIEVEEPDQPSKDQRREQDDLYASFQAAFRSQATTREGFKAYLPLLEEAGIDSDILDVGCGSGEWLQILREAGMSAHGVESNRTLIEQAEARQVGVTDADASLYLRTLPENSFRAITAFHFVEHLGFETLIDLLKEIHRTLRPGGLVILETPNPKNLTVGACNFYSDPTHQRPLFPESLVFMVKHLGFERAAIRYLHPVDGSPFKADDEASRALDSWFFSPRDYAVIAYKPEPQ